MSKEDKIDDNDKKIDDAAKKPDAKPGEVDPDTGKYTDDGVAALVDQIKNKKPDDKKSDDSKDDKKTSTKDTKSDDDDGQMVPISRLNKVIDERNNLRTQLESQPKPQVKEEDQPPTVEELRVQHKEKRKAWQKAVFDNDQDAADKLLDEMDTLEEVIDETRLNETANATRAQSADDIRYDNLLDEMTVAFPVIDKNSDAFDQKVVTEVFNMREAFIARGDTQTEALRKARDYILSPLGAKDTQKKVQDTTDKRNEDSKKNLADALSRQPTNVSDLGASSDAVNNDYGIDVKRLTPEQFDKLPDDVKQDLRGDTIKEHHLGQR